MESLTTNLQQRKHQAQMLSLVHLTKHKEAIPGLHYLFYKIEAEEIFSNLLFDISITLILNQVKIIQERKAMNQYFS